MSSLRDLMYDCTDILVSMPSDNLIIFSQFLTLTTNIHCLEIFITIVISDLLVRLTVAAISQSALVLFALHFSLRSASLSL